MLTHETPVIERRADGTEWVTVAARPVPKDPTPPGWFAKSVAKGLQMLTVLNLPGAPSHETAKSTAQVWIELLWGAEIYWRETEAHRIHAAFARLGREVREWPAPESLLKIYSPSHRPPEAAPEGTLALPAPTRERNRELASQRTREILAKLGRQGEIVKSPPKPRTGA